MDTNLYEEYLKQLVNEVEDKVGVMPTCLLKPLKEEPALISPIVSSPYTSPRISTVDEGLRMETKASKKEKSEKDVDTCEDEKQENSDGIKTDSQANGSVRWKERFAAFERNLQYLKDSMDELRSQDVKLVRQLLHVNDSIEELKWLNENYELCETKDKKDSFNNRSLSRYDSREQLHERWLSERRQLNTSRTSLNNSFSNLSTSLSRLNQNNNSNGLVCQRDQCEIAHVCGPDTSPISREEFEPMHQRTMSASCTEKSVYRNPLPLAQTRPASSTALVTMDIVPATSTPKAEQVPKPMPLNTQEKSNISNASIDNSQISRVRLESYGAQVRWYYRETSEDELYL